MVEPGIRVYVNHINPSGKKTIIFLYGWPANYRLFEYQYNILPQMGYRCIGIDMKGVEIQINLGMDIATIFSK